MVDQFSSLSNVPLYTEKSPGENSVEPEETLKS